MERVLTVELELENANCKSYGSSSDLIRIKGRKQHIVHLANESFEEGRIQVGVIRDSNS